MVQVVMLVLMISACFWGWRDVDDVMLISAGDSSGSAGFCW